MGDHRLGLRIQEYTIVGDGEQARQLVADNDDRGAKTVTKIDDQVVEPARGDRVQSGGRLVEEQDVGIERQRARQARPLAHAAAEFGGQLLDRMLHADQAELEHHQAADCGVVEAGEHLHRQGDVHADRHRAP